MSFFLLAFPALFSIINPLGGAFMFLGATKRLSRDMRTHLARWVAIHSFIILNVSLYVGAYVQARDASRIAFYPLTMPITTGPGTISVAVALGTSRPDHIRDFALFLLAATLVTGLMSLIIYALYRYADRVSHVVGPTGTTIIVRLSAFLLFCIGIQVLWNGASELIAGVIAR